MTFVQQVFEHPSRSHLYVAREPQGEQPQQHLIESGDSALGPSLHLPLGSAAPAKKSMSALLVTGLMYMFTMAGAYGIEESVMGGGPLLTIIFIVSIPTFMGVPTALVVAEMASAVPSNAGFLMWIHLSFHRVVYLTMVLLSLLLTFVDNALYPVLFSEYLCTAMTCSSAGTKLLRVGMITLTCILNLIGVETVGFASVALTIITVLPFLLLFVIQQFSTGFYLNWPAISFIPANVDWTTFITTVSWNLSGLEQAGALAEDVDNPQRTIIHALIPLVGLAFVTYIPPVLSGASVNKPTPGGGTGLELSDWVTGFWAELAHQIGGWPLKSLMVFGSVSSAFGLTLSALCTSTRMISGMALTEAFPSKLCDWLGSRNERFGTYHWALITNAVLTALFSTLLEFGPLVKVDQFLYGIRVSMMFLAFLRFRRLYPYLERPFRVPLSGWALYAVYSLSLLSFVALTLVSMLKDTETIIACTVVTGVCVAVAWAYCHFVRRHDFLGRIVTTVDTHDD